ncbi:hypothetical protein BLA29_011152, partial [Euroglyphus maynei]
MKTFIDTNVDMGELNENKISRENDNSGKPRPFRLKNLNKNYSNPNDDDENFMIELIEVSITNNGKQLLFDSLNLRIENGQIFGVIGSKRTGKTSLLETIATIRLPNSGTVTYYGEHYDQPVRIGFMPQTNGFFPNLTIAENLILMTRLHGLSMDVADNRYDRLINVIGISEAKQPLLQLNQSQQSLISLSLASIHSPSVLILDEPDF